MPSAKVLVICTHADGCREAHVIRNRNQVACYGILDALIDLTNLKSAKRRGYPIRYVGRSHPQRSFPLNR